MSTTPFTSVVTASQPSPADPLALTSRLPPDQCSVCLVSHLHPFACFWRAAPHVLCRLSSTRDDFTSNSHSTTLDRSFDGADKRARWDDWVPQDRLRKFNDENRELANNLKKELEAMRRGSQAQKTAPTSHKKKPDVASTRGSESRETPVASTSLAGRKRGRDFEVERVGHFTFISLSLLSIVRVHPPLSLLLLLAQWQPPVAPT